MKPVPLNIVDFQTRPDICDYMVGLISTHAVNILEPTKGAGNIVASLKNNTGKHAITCEGDYWDMWHPVDKYDAIIMNPPFTPMTECYKFLFDAMSRTDEIVALMPWLTIINADKRLKAISEFGLVSVTSLPRTAFKGSRIQSCILHMRKGYQKPTVFVDYAKLLRAA